MPTYQYVCSACEAPLEVVQAFTDDALTVCPSCGASALRKVYSAVGVVFKGSGFYRTDARSGSGAEAAGDSSSTSTASPAAPTPSSASDTGASPGKTTSTSNSSSSSSTSSGST
jgi:putative FmdB family regulatory protein